MSGIPSQIREFVFSKWVNNNSNNNFPRLQATDYLDDFSKKIHISLNMTQINNLKL